MVSTVTRKAELMVSKQSKAQAHVSASISVSSARGRLSEKKGRWKDLAYLRVQ